MIKKEEIDAFSSRTIHAQTKSMFLAINMHVMTQTLEEGDGPCLPHGLSIMNTYTEMATGSKQVVVVVKNLTATLITITKGFKIAQVVAANAIPLVGVSPGMLKKLNETQGIQQAGMLVEQRKEVVFQQLDLSGLEGWSAKNWAMTHALLAEYHDILSLELGELGCTDLAKQEIKVTDDEPFKERFWRILHLWWMRFSLTWKRCWKWVQFTQAKAHGAMLLCWYAWKKEVYASASTSVNWMQGPRKTFTHFHRYRKQLRA